MSLLRRKANDQFTIRTNNVQEMQKGIQDPRKDQGPILVEGIG